MGAGGNKVHEAYAVAPADAEVWGVQEPDLEEEEPLADAGIEPEPDPPATATAEDTEPATDMAAGQAPAGWDDAAVPVPQAGEPGNIAGVPLLVGGADLVDSVATVISYEGLGGSREVLHATVSEAAEGKLLEALALSEEKLVPIAVEKEIDGRLPMDEQHQLFDQVEKSVKSVNHHLKTGDTVPPHTKEAMGTLTAQLEQLQADPATTEDEKAMLAHYQAAAEQVTERLADGYAVQYAEGGKVPQILPYQVAQKVTVTEYIPAPAEEIPEGLLPARVRGATRIQPTISGGESTWDGKARSNAHGKEYVVDLGDGYTAVYRPYAAADGQGPDFSQRGTLEITAPTGGGHVPELVNRLGQLNLVNRPMSAAEGEWAYLTRNVWAQQLDGHKAVADALAQADGLEDALQEVLVAERAHEAIGMGEKELVGFAKHIRLEAEAKALPEKVRLVRDAVAKVVGVGSGEALIASAGYDPTPRRSGGWLVWDRFDVAKDPKAVHAAFGSRGLVHHLTGRNLLDVLRNGGALASTERRRIMGAGTGTGMSESADMKTGGARSVFLRVGSKPGHGPAFYWDDPSRLLRRADWYAYPSDHFGSINPSSSHSTSGQTRNPITVAGFNGGSNEVMFRDGIDLLGAEAPTSIVCGGAAERAKVLELLGQLGVHELGGRAVEEVVK